MGITEQDLAEIAVTVAADAADLVRRTRVDSFDTKSSPTDVVTAADRASEELIRARLAELRPGDAVLGEEGGGTSGPGVTWVVDPIDGTVNFLYGNPAHAVSIGAEVDGVAVAGAVVEPVSGRRWTAVRGGGAYLDGVRLSVSSPPSLEQTLVATGFSYRVDRRVEHAELVLSMIGEVRDIRRNGSAALDLCGVAAGWVDAYFERWLGHWDYSAGALIAEEAGAVVRVVDGGAAVFAGAPSIADELLGLLGEPWGR